jgi:hypothetical protein
MRARWLAVLWGTSTAAWAHGPDAHRLLIEVEDGVLRVTATPGADALGSADADADGELDRAEVAAAREAIRAAFHGALRLTDAAGVAAACEPASVSTVGEGAGWVRISTRCTLPAPPAAIRLSYTLEPHSGVQVEAIRTWRVDDLRWAPLGPVERRLLLALDGEITLLAGETCEP